MLSVIYAECLKQTHDNVCRYTDCHYPKCRGAVRFTLKVVCALTLTSNITLVSNSYPRTNTLVYFVSGNFIEPYVIKYYGRNLQMFAISWSACSWWVSPAYSTRMFVSMAKSLP
jgi:hypothetical protein